MNSSPPLRAYVSRDSAPPRFALRILGTASLGRLLPDGTVSPLLGPGKALALIAYLACAPGRCASRERLVDLLWSDLDTEKGRQALRQHLWRLKQTLGTAVVAESGTETLSLAIGLESDRDALLEAAEHQRHEDVVALWAGELFPDFASQGGRGFEEWLDAERPRLRSVFLRSAEIVVRNRLAGSRNKEAIALARGMRDVDLLSEFAWRLLFEAINASGDTAGLGVEIDSFEELMRHEGREPETATRQLIRRIVKADPVSPDAPFRIEQLSAELIGREREFSVLLRAADAARRGRFQHVQVDGASGDGKSRLLYELEKRLRLEPLRLVAYRSTIGTRRVPYSTCADLVGILARLPGSLGVSPLHAETFVALDASLREIFPGVQREAASGDEALRRRADAFGELLRAVSAERPLALLLDDLQWADEQSQAVLSSAFERMSRQPLLLITASRLSNSSQVETSITSRIRVSPLPPDAIRRLIDSIALLPEASWSDDLAPALASGTAGSPLLILEALQSAIDQSLLKIESGIWHCSDTPALLHLLASGGAIQHRLQCLSETERQALLFVALSGTSLKEDQTRALFASLGLDEVDAVSALQSLEAAGFLRHTGRFYRVSHDRIAETSIELATPSSLATSHKCLGRALGGPAGAVWRDAGSPKRSIYHAVRASDIDFAAIQLAEVVRHARKAGDGRSLRDIAVDVAEMESQDFDVDALLRRLPTSVKIGPITRFAIGGAAVMAAAGLAALILKFRDDRPVRSPALTVLVEEGTRLTAYEVATDSTRWDPSLPLDIASEGRRIGSLPSGLDYYQLIESPKGRGHFTAVVTTTDTGGTDLFAVGTSGSVRRLTSTPQDDLDPAWSPDGSSLAFGTARWNKRSRTDIAIMRDKEGQVRQLTSGDETDRSPAWSPSGTRVAFIRDHWDGGGNSACVVDYDGGGLRCVRLSAPFERAAILLGWIDEGTLLLQHPRALLSVSIADGSTSVLEAASGACVFNPDLRWRACVEHGGKSRALTVGPLGIPTLARRSGSITDGRSWLPIVWSRLRDPRRRIPSRLEIEPTSGIAPVGVPFHLQTKLVDSLGEPIATAPVRWTLADSTLGQVDSLGVLVAAREGTLLLSASMGGRFADSLLLRAVRNDTSRLLHEDWLTDLDQWNAFGDPQPSIMPGPGGVRGLWNAGDGQFSSGVYAPRTFDTSAGLAVEFSLSTPITDMQWQDVTVGLAIGIDSSAIRTWDHRSGYLFSAKRSYEAFCGAQYPGAQEGPAYADSIRILADGSYRAAPRAFRTGAWQQIRIQVFPDGRCGIALNGQRVSDVHLPVTRPSSALLVVMGNSVGTRTLVGPLRVVQGVRGW